MKKNCFDVIIIGAGVAGLACADEVVKSLSKKILVIDKNKYVGGMACTLKHKGFYYDLAPHRWFTKNQELNKWIDDLMKKELVWVKKTTPMYQFGNFFEYPIKISDVLKKINPLMSLVMISTYLYERARQKIYPKKTITMKDAYIERFGWGLYKWFNEEYNEKLWGVGGCDAMSADFVNQRVKNLSFTTALLNAIGVGKGKVISLVDKFRFPMLGIGRISENLAKRIKTNGGLIKLGEKVIEIKKLNSGYLVKTNMGSYETKEIVNSMAVDQFLKCFSKEIYKRIENETKKLTYVHQKIVILFAKAKRLTNFTWVYVHPKKIKTFRFLETNNWSTHMSPAGHTSLVFEYPYHIGDEIDKMADRDLVETTTSDFIKYFAPKNFKKSKIVDVRVYYVPCAYPKYDFKYKKAIERIYRFVEKELKGVQLIGRNGMFHYNNLDHSIYTGILAGKNIVSEKKLYDLTRVNNEAEYLEEIKF